MALSTNLFGQSGGQLIPSGIPEGGVMKTLDEVEARTPISDLPYVISTQGSYYLTKNLIATSASDTITITVSNVTLDLNGFNIDSSSYNNVGISAAGTVLNSLYNISIQNGSVSNHQVGVLYQNVDASRISEVRFDGAGIPIYLLSGSGRCNGNTIEQCRLIGALNDGIRIDSVGGECSGNVIRECEVLESGGTAIHIKGDSAITVGNVVEKCSVSNSLGHGINIEGTATVIKNCSVYNSSGYGLKFNLFAKFNRVEGNSITAAREYGIRVQGSSGNRVESNIVRGVTAASTSYGITASGGDNLIVKNVGVGQDDNFAILATETRGPEVVASGVLATTGGPVHPWANFSLK